MSVTDLIKRLRDPLECPDTKSVFKLCEDAADEIESLSSELHSRSDEAAMLLMENERLRAALEKLECDAEWCGKSPFGRDPGLCQVCVAREALKDD